ncbi:MAG: hypothetical protein HOH14_07350 [Gammaproteobacteria bacterium]|jgi:hypothetical protein|nr:hypothetical protein [Gammaproteobacteria bacterium]
MTFRKTVSFLVLAIALLGSQVTLAHHAFTAQYDADARKEITGVVVKVEWLNPHAYFYIDVEDPDTGEVATWACELGSPVSMQRQGWTRESLVLGDYLIVEGALARDGSSSISASSVVIEETGKRLFSRQQN